MRYKTHTPTDIYHGALAANAVALEFGIATTDIMDQEGKRGPRTVAFARQIAIYLCRTVFNINTARVGRVFNRHPTSVAYACEVVEDSREDPRMNEHISRLEEFLVRAPRPKNGERPL